MALNQKALQKKRAKRAEKRKQAKPATAPSKLAQFQGLWKSVAAEAPIGNAWVPSNLFETGLGTVWLTRRLADGSYAIAGFLVDVYCLGVKNALYNLIEEHKYPALLAELRGELSATGGQLLPVEPAYLRKLVEGAAAYAETLGFQPHPDYKLASLIFGDIDAAACPTQFQYGKEGKPLYIPSSDDTPSEHRRVLGILSRSCGPDGYRLFSDP
jgi:hypothetical protein